MSLLDALGRLDDAGINMDDVEFRYSVLDNGPPINPTNWAVAEQTPPPKTRVRSGRRIVLTVIRIDEGF